MVQTAFQRKLVFARKQTRIALLELISDVTPRTEIDTETFSCIVRLAIFAGLDPEDIATHLSVMRTSVMRWADETMSPHELARGGFVVKICAMLKTQPL